MSLSTAEAKYVTACSDSCVVVWLRKLLSDLFDLQLDATCIYCDNQIYLKLSENPVFHDKFSGGVKLQYRDQIPLYQRYFTERRREAPICCD